MSDNEINVSLDKLAYTVGIINRFLKKFLSLVLFSQYVFITPILITKDPFLGFTVYKGYVIAGIVMTLLLFYSVNRAITVYNSDMCMRFLAQNITTYRKKLKFIFTQKENLIELSALAAMHVIFPAKLFHAGWVWLFCDYADGSEAKARLLLILLPTLLVVYIISYFSAMNYWNKEEREKLENRRGLGKEELKEVANIEKRHSRRLYCVLLFLFFLGSISAMFLIPAIFVNLIPVLLTLMDLKIVIPILLLILIPFTVRSVKALYKRRKFIKALKKFCREKKFRLSKIKHPYGSLFSLYRGESFVISNGKKSYACKLIAAKKRSRPLYIMNGGRAAFLVKVRFLKIVLFSYTKEFNFGFDSSFKKIVIINPVPQQILFPRTAFNDETDEKFGASLKTKNRLRLLGYHNLDSRELDNADIIDGYEIYNATGFINALERDCIDRD